MKPGPSYMYRNTRYTLGEEETTFVDQEFAKGTNPVEVATMVGCTVEQVRARNKILSRKSTHEPNKSVCCIQGCVQQPMYGRRVCFTHALPTYDAPVSGFIRPPSLARRMGRRA